MKKKYLPPTLDCKFFEQNDVITTSGADEVGTTWYDSWTQGLNGFFD